MVDREAVLGALERVQDPELGGNIVELGMVSEVLTGVDGRVEVGIALTIAECPLRNQIEGDAKRKVAGIPGVTEVVIRTTAMTKKQRSQLMSVARRRVRENAEPTQVNPTTRVIAVSSGKGGVGKSTVAVNLAVAISTTGMKVGVLDADIWGFSIPRMLGVHDRLQASNETGLIEPAEVEGVKVVSSGLIIESEETALMWRGLMLSKALEQFLKQVHWGDIDYLIIDMPPGTGDIQMALTRLLPQAEMVVVTTPQRAAQKVAVRVADMARRSHMPILGVIENMVGEVFGSGGGAELADSLGVPLIESIPLDHEVAHGGDEGMPVVGALPDTPAARAFTAAAKTLLELMPPAADETCTGRIAKLLAELEGEGAA